jgi:hypothetical protein
MVPKAAPIMMPTAISITLPFRANSLKSFIISFLAALKDAFKL